MTRVAHLTDEELAAIVRSAVRAEFEAVGLRVTDPDDQDEAKEDFRFIRKIRKGFEGAAGKIGSAVILAIVSGALWLLWTGFQAILPKQ